MGIKMFFFFWGGGQAGTMELISSETYIVSTTKTNNMNNGITTSLEIYITSIIVVLFGPVKPELEVIPSGHPSSNPSPPESILIYFIHKI